MASRTKKIMELAREACRKQQTCEEDQCNKENISPINDISQNNSNSLDHIILNNELSPEDFSKLIDQAEIVFDNEDLLNIPVVKHLGDDNNFGEIVLHRGYSFNNITNELTGPNVSTSFCSKNGTTLLSSMEVDLDVSTVTMSENEHCESELYSLHEKEERNQTVVSTDNQDNSGPNNVSTSFCSKSEATVLSSREVVFTDNQDDSGLNDVDENTKLNNTIESTEKQKKLKKIKGVNKRTINKQLRMQGGEYLGFTKPRAQKNTFHNKNRPDRKLGNRCDCNSKLSCSALSETSRQTIFNQFWTELNWDQKKIYVVNSVKRISPKRPRKSNETSRRTGTLQYEVNVNNKAIRVCKKMYLNTLCLGEWSVRNWASESTNGMSNSSKNKVSKRQKRKDVHEESRQFLREFLENLHKLPSHYCRKDTKKMYLEQCFQSYAHLHRVYEAKCQENNKSPLSIATLTHLSNQMNIALFHPRKDQCDTCFKYKNNNLSEEEYNKHIEKKNLARDEKAADKEKAIKGECHVITMDVQAVKLAPQIEASALYYKTKLCCHNFTMYNLRNNRATCYWYNETEADGQGGTFASFVVDYLEEHFLKKEDKTPIIMYSDGCTAQNRNCIMANALLFLADKYQVVITQKFLEKGHTQMECDSVHSTIETRLKNKEIYLPSDYFRTSKDARLKDPYVVKNMDFDFFFDYGDKSLLKYSSIRPGKKTGDPTVTDLRVLQYSKNKIQYKLNFDQISFQDLPIRPNTTIDLKTVTFPKLFSSKLPISKKKYDHLQEIKLVIPKDCWSFYEQLPYK